MIKLNSGADEGDRDQHIRVVSCSALGADPARMCFYENNSVSIKLSKKTNLVNKAIFALAFSFSVYSFSSDSYALGVGSATADSYIGEVLSVRVPLFSVADPNSLTVKLTQADGSSASLLAEVTRANSQLGVIVRSEGRVNEPYLNFTLELSDSNNVFSKEFTVLLNLSPLAPGSTRALSNANLRGSQDYSAQPLGNSTLIAGSVMGPYEWAESGRIPEKFGAVLDGQSLWRVARRINRGLGVSINQMMWSLYQQNPEAFSSKSINSLKAGSYLKIPTYQMASQLSDSQAKARLDGTQDNSSLVASSEVQSSNQQAPEQVARGNSDQTSEEAQQFQLTAIDQAASGDGSVSGAKDAKSQEIISSLAETVGNLTQELIRKDKKIAFLEEKVRALAEFAGVDADLSADLGESLSSSNAVDIESATLAAELFDDAVDPLDSDLLELESLESVELVDDTELTDVAEPTELDLAEAKLAEAAIDFDVTAPEDDTLLEDSELDDAELIAEVEEPLESSEPTQPSKVVSPQKSDMSFVEKVGTWFDKFTTWHWVALGLAGLVLVAGLFRRRLAALFGSLNLFGGDDGVEFKQSVFDDTDAPIGNSPQPAEANRDFSVMSSVKRELDKDEAIEGVSYLAVNEDGEYEESDTSEFSEGDLEFVTDEDLTFGERFERLIKDKDFDFARELLDFARYNEIDEERYHCERLRLLQAMQDEDGFYEYYYEIESKIPSFAPNYQTQISQLVVELAQHEK